jgi:hypothetical protein
VFCYCIVEDASGSGETLGKREKKLKRRARQLTPKRERIVKRELSNVKGDDASCQSSKAIGRFKRKRTDAI